MEWTKIKVKHFASNNLTKAQKGSLVTLIVHTAMLERVPSDKEIASIIGKSSYKSLVSLHETLGNSLQNILEKVVEDSDKLKHVKNLSAETSRRYRETHKKVTRHSQSSCDATEKRREEKNIQETPQTHPFLEDASFKKLFDGYVEMRKQMKCPLTNKAFELVFKKFSAWGVEKSKLALEKSIESGWRGLFEPNITSLDNTVAGGRQYAQL